MPASVGLGGDGDEVDAIRAVEEAFGVALDYGDARNWRTAGDVYAALRREAVHPEQPGDWERFAAILTDETGVNPATIEPGSPLLSTASGWHYVRDAFILLIVAGALASTWIMLVPRW